MTAIKHKLQRQVFLPSEEQLVAVVHVNKVGKKKKESFLCAAVTTEAPMKALIYQVKKSDRGENQFKKKLSWGLRELKVIDGKSSSEFDMHFEKVYHWKASSVTEKNAFIQCLWKLSMKYLLHKPKFVQIAPGLLEEESAPSESDKSVEQAEDIALNLDSDKHALTEKEEQDLVVLMEQCEYAVSNAEMFTNDLTLNLSMLDGANIHSIMGSTDEVNKLMLLLDNAIKETERLEEKLDVYDTKLKNLKDLMDTLREKDTKLNIRNLNYQKLSVEIESIITQLELDPKHSQTLLDGDLTTKKGIEKCGVAAKAVQACMQADIHPALKDLAAVKEQMRKFTILKNNFSQRLCRQLNNLFIHQGNDMSEANNKGAGEAKLPLHTNSHQALLPYSDLMLWLKTVDPENFKIICKVYTDSLRKLYDRELTEFLDNSKQKLAPRLERKGSTKQSFRGTLQASRLGGSSSSLNKHPDHRGEKHHRSSITTLDSEHDSEPDLVGRAKFDQMFEYILSELGPWCLVEQDFCEQFFHLNQTPEETNMSVDSRDRSVSETSDPWQLQAANTTQEQDDLMVENLGSGLTRTTSSVIQRQMNEEIRQMMSDLFPNLDLELKGFIDFGDKQDNFNSLYMLMRMSEHVLKASNAGSFLNKTFGTCLVIIKRNFDKFINAQKTSFSETKLSKKSKAGIIPFVHDFRSFAEQAETIFKGSDRRTDLDKAYVTLTEAIFNEINRLAMESHKTSPNVVRMENYHHIYAILSSQKIACLETQRKDAKARYIESRSAYVTTCLGRPMEKLSLFFEGIESKVAQGVKEEEVGYQLAFSKQELRKVIKEYPSKEVKKNLEHLYKKMDKEMCDEENLMQVVWHSTQDEFLKLYKYFAKLIARCYPNSGITLDFTIDDLLSYFSDIALSH